MTDPYNVTPTQFVAIPQSPPMYVRVREPGEDTWWLGYLVGWQSNVDDEWLPIVATNRQGGRNRFGVAYADSTVEWEPVDERGEEDVTDRHAETANNHTHPCEHNQGVNGNYCEQWEEENTAEEDTTDHLYCPLGHLHSNIYRRNECAERNLRRWTGYQWQPPTTKTPPTDTTNPTPPNSATTPTT